MGAVFTDSFTDTNDVLLQSHNASWINNVGSMKINTNANCGGQAGYHNYRWSGNSLDNNQYSKYTIVANSADYWLATTVRQPAGAGYTCYEFSVSRASGRELNYFSSGTQSLLASTYSSGTSLNDVVEIRANGTTITPLRNGITDSIGAVTDSSLTSGYAGLGGYDGSADCRMDDYEAGNLSSGTTYNEESVLQKKITLVNSSDQTISGVVTLTKKVTALTSSILDILASLTLTKKLTETDGSTSAIEETVSLSNRLSAISVLNHLYSTDDVILEWGTIYEDSISLIASKTINQAGVLTIDGIINVSRSESILLVSALGPIIGSTTWGQVTGVTETNTRTLASNWTGTGTPSGSGDTEVACLASGEYLISEVVQTGAVTVTLLYDTYRTGTFAGTLIVQYRHGATQAACEADTWKSYTVPFTSDGFVQIRIEAP